MIRIRLIREAAQSRRTKVRKRPSACNSRRSATVASTASQVQRGASASCQVRTIAARASRPQRLPQR